MTVNSTWIENPSQRCGQISTLSPELKPGAIILLHDGYDNAPGADRSGTLPVAKIIIRSAKQQGYRFVGVSELLSM